jgi:hypothetical protein
MFGELAKFLVELFVESPAVFIAMADGLIEFIERENLFPLLYLLSVVVIVGKSLLEDETLFALLASIGQTSVIFAMAFLIMQWWPRTVPAAGEYLYAKGIDAININSVTYPEDEDICGMTGPEWQTMENRVIQRYGQLSPDATKNGNAEMLDSLNGYLEPLRSLCGQIENYMDTMDTVLSKGKELLDDDDEDEDEKEKDPYGEDFGLALP